MRRMNVRPMRALPRTLRPAVTVAAAVCLWAMLPFGLPRAATRDLEEFGSPLRPAPADPAIAQALRQISPQQIRRTIETLAGFRTRSTLSSMDPDLPKGQGINAAADWIESELKRYAAACGGCLEVKRDTFTESPQDRVPSPTTITNVYAVLRGTDPVQAKRVYFVSGHYDSRSTDVMDPRAEAPGANDDASGVAVSLECARVLSRLRPAATIVFAAVAGEEQGLNGSRHLAKLATAEGWQVEAELNNDIVGGNTTPGDRFQDKALVRVFSEGIPVSATPEQAKLIVSLGYESDSPSRELARAVLDVGETYGGLGLADQARADQVSTAFKPILEFRRDRFLRGGDHTSFNQEGFAAVRFTEWREDFNHQHQLPRVENGIEYGDLLKFVDYRYVGHVAAINAGTLATLAMAPPAPVNVRILTQGLGNDTALQWESGAGQAADTHYEVLWRELGAATWQRVADARHASLTLPISKDNVIFAVRSVDTLGHRSPAVVPVPQR